MEKTPTHQKQRTTKGPKNYFLSYNCDLVPPEFDLRHIQSIWNNIGNWKIEILVRCEYGWPKWRVDGIKAFGLFSFIVITALSAFRLVSWYCEHKFANWRHIICGETYLWVPYFVSTLLISKECLTSSFGYKKKSPGTPWNLGAIGYG